MYQRVTVRRGLGGGFHGDDARCAATIVDDDLLTERLAQARGVRTCYKIRAATGGHRHDEADGLVGIGLGCRAACCPYAKNIQ